MTVESATLRRPSVSGGAGGDVTEKGFYDPVTASWTIKVLPGRFYITPRADEVIVTVLGSCVSACIRDVQTGVGGMNHFMLASDAAGQWGSDSQSTRYGNFAMEKLINELIKAGCPRRIQYFPATGRVVRKLLTGGDRDLIVREESEYAKQLVGAKATAGEVQLFGVKKKPAGEVQLFGAKRK